VRIDAGTNERPVASSAQERPNRFWRTAIVREWARKTWHMHNIGSDGGRSDVSVTYIPTEWII